MVLTGKVVLELNPQGTLAERIAPAARAFRHFLPRRAPAR